MILPYRLSLPMEICFDETGNRFNGDPLVEHSRTSPGKNKLIIEIYAKHLDRRGQLTSVMR